MLDLAADSYTMLLQALDNMYPGFEASESGLRSSIDGSSPESPWLSSGGLMLQYALDRALADRHTPGASSAMANLSGSVINAAKLPLPAYSSNYAPGSSWIVYVIPF